MKTALYRHLNSKGELLYVGISLHAVIRLAQHKKNARWFDQVAMIKVEWLDDRKKAMAAESRAITEERPIYNNGGRGSAQLTELFVNRIKKKGRYSNGQNLYLQVGNNGICKSWIFRYKGRDGKEHHAGLGPAPLFTIEEAVKRAEACRECVTSGCDPIKSLKTMPWHEFMSRFGGTSANPSPPFPCSS